jgi:hypothetical protein
MGLSSCKEFAMSQTRYLEKNPGALKATRIIQRTPQTDAPTADASAAQRAAQNPRALSPAVMPHLQQLMGNQAIQKMFASERNQRGTFVQTKLMVGAAGDAYEQEADAVAQQVTTPNATMNRQPSAASGTIGDGLMVGGEFEQRLAQRQGQGQALTAEVQRELEPKFGAEFNAVRVHTDDEAADMTSSVQAQAFTHGNDIYMGAGQYQPDTGAGKQLLAHELTHTIQQTGGVQHKAAPTPMIQRKNLSQEEQDDIRKKLKEALTPHKYERLKSLFFIKQADLVAEILEKKDAINAMGNTEFDSLARNDDMVNKIHTLSKPGYFATARSWLSWGKGSTKDEGDKSKGYEDETKAHGDWTAEDEKSEEKEPPFELQKIEIVLLEEEDFKFEKEKGLAKVSGKGGLKGALDIEKLKKGNLEGLNLEGVGEIGFQFGKAGEKEGTLDWNWKGNGIAGVGKLEGFAGGKTEAKAKGKLGYDQEKGLQAGLKGKASAFLGASIESSTKVEIRLGGEKILTTAGKLGLALGVGGEYAGKIEWSGGKLTIGGKGKIAAGLGFSFGYQLEFDTVGVFSSIMGWLKSWIW